MYKPAIDYIMLDVPVTGESHADICRAALMMCIQHCCTVRFTDGVILFEVCYPDLMKRVHSIHPVD